MKTRVFRQEYANGGHAYLIVNAENGKQFASAWKDDIMAKHISESLNLVDDLIKTGLYMRVLQKLDDIKKYNEALNLTQP